jgi:hypothetical protein
MRYRRRKSTIHHRKFVTDVTDRSQINGLFFPERSPKSARIPEELGAKSQRRMFVHEEQTGIRRAHVRAMAETKEKGAAREESGKADCHTGRDRRFIVYG